MNFNFPKVWDTIWKRPDPNSSGGGEDMQVGVSDSAGGISDGGDLTLSQGAATRPNQIYMNGGIATNLGLTTEEEQELKQLQEKREVKMKQTKMAEFRKLPAHIREAIVIRIRSQEEEERISAISFDPCPREQELMNKKSQFTYRNASDLVYASTPTIEELEDIHAQQCLEKEITD